MDRITYCPTFTDSFKFNSYTLNFVLPLSAENVTSCVLLSGILERGCEKYGEMDRLIMKLQELYSATISLNCEKYGENLVFSIQGHYMNDRYAVEEEQIRSGVLDLMSQILFAPMTENGRFRNDFFEQEKKNLETKIKGIFNDKRVYAKLRCDEIMFEGNAYSVSSRGDLNALKDITNEKLFSFYRHLLSESTCLVCYIGERVDLQQLTEQFFSKLLSGNTIDIVTTEYVTPEKIKTEEETCQVAQGKLCMGYRLTQETDYYANRLFNVIYGGSPTSKLFMNVREKMSLCYYCSSAMDPYVHSMFISSGIEFSNFDVAKAEIIRQLDDMKNGVISDEEFENGKAYLIDVVKGIGDSHESLLNESMRGYFLGFSDDIETQVAKIKALSKSDIVKVARCVQADTIYFLKGSEE